MVSRWPRSALGHRKRDVHMCIYKEQESFSGILLGFGLLSGLMITVTIETAVNKFVSLSPWPTFMEKRERNKLIVLLEPRTRKCDRI